jgi:hypothetical protein
VRRDDFPGNELDCFMIPLEAHYPEKPKRRELNLFSKKNYTYVDNRKVTVISNSIVVFKL